LPWSRAIYKGNVKYSHNMCPNTLDWLGRSIALGIHQHLTTKDADDIVRAIQKVAKNL